MLWKTAMVLFTLFAFCVLSFGATIFVPDDYDTIQEAIDAASNGDYVRVREGVYQENLVINYKDIYLISQAGYDAIISGTGTAKFPKPVIKCVNSDAYIDGFIIMNGTGEFVDEYNIVGAGVYAHYCDSVTVKNCFITCNNIFYYNHAIPTAEQGVAIYVGEVGIPTEGADDIPNPVVTITNNLIEYNGYHEDSAGGCCLCFESLAEGSYIGYNIVRYNKGGMALRIYPYGCDLDGNQFYGNKPHSTQSCKSVSYQNLQYDAVISNNLFADGLDYYGNPTQTSEVHLYNAAFSDTYICNNTFVNRSYLTTNLPSVSGGGLFNNIFWCDDEDYQIVLQNNSDMPIDYNDIYDGEDGIYCGPGSSYDWGDHNIESYPIWKDEETYDYRIKMNSPCKEAGGNAYQMTRHDWLMDTRLYGDYIDIGCDEWDNSVPF